MKKVTAVMTFLFLLSTAISTVAVDSTGIPTWDWTGVGVNPVGGGQLKIAQYTTPGTYSWTAPPGVTEVWLTMCGGGGGGETYNGWRGGEGGGAGEGFYRRPVAVTPGTSYTVVVGSGGAGGVYGGSSPTNGGNSSFGALVARGGKRYGVYGGGYCYPGTNNGCGGDGEDGRPHPVFVSVTGALGGLHGHGYVSGGGGGGWGNGGSGGYENGDDGGTCAGGGGSYNATSGVKGGNGGPGLVIIEWFE